ncbi:hypothetical protein [Pseudovibrio brasiliensis]|uniref:Uncharacterized protein n=1 Tax=Pseudovibrio brasiliensis TaxID=1898042 RepID=A0ABX8AHW2_9HYPH|nr:hypothetical protein [Pseudovibrio brasiliensis]QUS54503.1 hypothetical protein KGB56_13995 [Pseudovibrio brasiliensis]
MTVPDLVYNVRANDKSRATFERNRRELQKTRRETKLLNMDMGGLGRSIGSIKGKAIAGVTAAVTALVAASKQAITEGSKLAKVADRVGLTTDELQRLRYGFELTGVAAGTTDTAMQRFSRRIGEAANGSGVLHDILKANGVQLRDSSGKMKTQGQILGEYADLIKNASSEQERLLLSFKAFDREGAGLVLALKNGSKGLDELMGKADEAGGVLDEKLLRKAEEIDDEFAKMWRTFEIGAKRATLAAVNAMDAAFNTPIAEPTLKDLQVEFSRKLPGLNRELSLAQTLGDEARIAEIEGQIDAVNARLAGIQKERQLRHAGLSDGPARRGGRRRRSKETDTPTIIPGEKTDSSGGGGSTRTKVDPYTRVLEQLKFERDLLSMNAQEQSRANALRLAGVEAASKQGQELIKVTDEIYAQTQAQKQHNEVVSLLGGIAKDSMSQFIDALGIADTAAGQLVATLAEAAAQAAFMGQGPLASLFGTSHQSNLSTALMSTFQGFFADGGVLGAGEWGFAGENGIEPVVGPAKIISNKEAFGGSERGVVVNQYIQTPDVESFRQSQGQVQGMLVDALSRGQRNR